MEGKTRERRYRDEELRGDKERERERRERRESRIKEVLEDNEGGKERRREVRGERHR